MVSESEPLGFWGLQGENARACTPFGALGSSPLKFTEQVKEAQGDYWMLRTAIVAVMSAVLIALVTHYQPADVLHDKMAAGAFTFCAAFLAMWFLPLKKPATSKAAAVTAKFTNKK